MAALFLVTQRTQTDIDALLNAPTRFAICLQHNRGFGSYRFPAFALPAARHNHT
jgi:hypothetical protein